ncbi:hypothetical protein DDQ41_23650 [Streptomyces spongiicola]|uniref:Uncharacterized protein n=1 Tax=Streptomyces spongiicola TaxID=1690221 RepID=A0ABM6VBL6_9ACTN|nr:hypothetical protein DDQ41_23650 [Streptomyces spongiicola]
MAGVGAVAVAGAGVWSGPEDGGPTLGTTEIAPPGCGPGASAAEVRGGSPGRPGWEPAARCEKSGAAGACPGIRPGVVPRGREGRRPGTAALPVRSRAYRAPGGGPRAPDRSAAVRNA